MHPWKVSVGLTLAAAGALAILLPARLAYLSPYYGLLWREHGIAIALHAALAAACAAALVYWAARKAGLSDLGDRLAHADRGLRERGAYDAELGETLRRDKAGQWDG